MSLEDHVSNGTTSRIDDLAEDALNTPDEEVQAEAAEAIEEGSDSLLSSVHSALLGAFYVLYSALKTGASMAWSATTTAFTAVRNGLGAALVLAATFAKNNEKKLVALSIAATVFVVLAYIVSKRDVDTDLPVPADE